MAETAEKEDAAAKRRDAPGSVRPGGLALCPGSPIAGLSAADALARAGAAAVLGEGCSAQSGTQRPWRVLLALMAATMLLPAVTENPATAAVTRPASRPRSA